MAELKQMKCEPCRGDAPGVSDEEAADLQAKVPEWEGISHDDSKYLQREFKFDNFAQALTFTDKVGALAEEQGHHPSLLTEWGRVRVQWWTHKINDLHQNDFIMAAKTDELYAGK